MGIKKDNSNRLIILVDFQFIPVLDRWKTLIGRETIKNRVQTLIEKDLIGLEKNLEENTDGL